MLDFKVLLLKIMLKAADLSCCTLIHLVKTGSCMAKKNTFANIVAFFFNALSTESSTYAKKKSCVFNKFDIIQNIYRKLQSSVCMLFDAA